jgi:phage gp45-like
MMDPIFQNMDRLLRPIKTRISNFMLRGIIHFSTESGRILQVSVGQNDAQDQIKNCEHFGFSSNPPPSSDALLLFPGGLRDVGFCISTQSQKKPPVDLKDGESLHYNEEGSYIALKKKGQIQIQNEKAELMSTLVELIEVLENLSQLKAFAKPGGNYPGGYCDVSIPGFDLSSVKKKLKSFLGNS